MASSRSEGAAASSPHEGAVVPFPPCALCEERLHFYLEGEADPSLARAIEAHLEGCPRCAARLRLLEEERLETVEALSRSPALSKRFPERVIGEIRRRSAEERDRRLIRKLARLGLGAGGLAAAAAVALVISLLAGRTPQVPFAPPPGTVNQTLGAGGPGGLKPAIGPAAPGALAAVTAAERSTRALAARELLVLPPLIHCPDDLPAWSPGAPKAEAFPATLISWTRAGPRLSETIEFSATMFRREETLPCTRDINNDGQTNVSDAAHLFMLSMAPPESLNPYFTGDEIDLECNPSSACLIY